jgi:hypothetical protein
MIDTQDAASSASATATGVIDVDIHNTVPKTDVLFPYLPSYFVEYIQNTLFKGTVDNYYPPKAPISARPGSRPADGSFPGSDLKHIQDQVLDADNVEVGILNCLYAIDSLHNPDAAITMAAAVNDWQAGEWLDKEPRLRASIVIPVQIPELAAREIDRAAERHKGFVQVLVPVRTHTPLGSRLFHPMWEAIERNNLVAGVHFGGVPGVPPTPEGWPSYFYEEYAGMAQVFATQLTSIVTEGVFDHCPKLRMSFLESGFTWIAPHLWRFDKEWKNLRRLVPWVRRPPSEYVREHIKVSVLPLDAPSGNTRQLMQAYEQLGSDDMLMYASDYPHLHMGDPDAVLLQHLSPGVVQKIKRDNARAHYGL